MIWPVSTTCSTSKLVRWYLSRKISVVAFDLYFFVHIFETQHTFDRLKINRVFKLCRFGQKPLTIRLSDIMLNMIMVLGDKKVITKRLDGAVVFEFQSPIIALCGR